MSDNLIERDYTLWIANTSTRKSYVNADFSRPFALIVGSERKGIQKEVYNYPVNEVCIPRRGKAESLNVGIATSILLAESFRNLNLPHSDYSKKI